MIQRLAAHWVLRHYDRLDSVIDIGYVRLIGDLWSTGELMYVVQAEKWFGLL